MRWQKMKYGNTREVRRFLIFPVTIDDQTRWLEWATIIQVVEYVYFIDAGVLFWCNKKWKDK